MRASTQVFQLRQPLRVDVVGGGRYVHSHSQLHRQLEEHPPDAALALRDDGLEGGGEDTGKIILGMAGGKVAAVKLDRLFYEFAFAFAVVFLIPILRQFQDGGLQPELEAALDLRIPVLEHIIHHHSS